MVDDIHVGRRDLVVPQRLVVPLFRVLHQHVQDIMVDGPPAPRRHGLDPARSHALVVELGPGRAGLEILQLQGLRVQDGCQDSEESKEVADFPPALVDPVVQYGCDRHQIRHRRPDHVLVVFVHQIG